MYQSIERASGGAETFGRPVLNSRWQFKKFDERLALAIAQHHSLTEITARMLASRGISVDEAENFLKPTLRNYLPDPFILNDMEKAASRLASAAINKEKAGIFGDYDVDGATASALLRRFLAMLGVEAEIHIPDRIKEGYGPNKEALISFKDTGCSLAITVDCGAVAFEPIEAATEAGLDMIVVDHHLGEIRKPKAFAVVNPNSPEEDGSLGHICAVGVAFLLAVGTVRKLREAGFFKDGPEPDLLSLLDLVALGTVCDVMPLTGLNRAYVAQGLKVMAGRSNQGLAALMDIARVEDRPGVYHAGFIIGPRINAGGRIGDAGLGAKILSCSDYSEALEIAQKLEQHNLERRSIEAAALEEALAQAEVKGTNQPVIFVASRNWHPGIVGLVAGRLKERYNKPVAAISIANGVAKASARSVTGVDLGGAVAAARSLGMLITGGGHKMAAGFTMEESRMDEVHAFLCDRLSASVSENTAEKVLEIDGAVSPSGVESSLVKEIAQAGPFGFGNPEPRFAVRNARVVRVDPVGADHVRCIVTDSENAGESGKARIKAIAFRAMGNPLGEALRNAGGKVISLAGTLKLANWQGQETAEMVIEDMAL